MCGFVGFIDHQRQRSEEQLHRTVNRMSASIAHRGPDDLGSWVDEDAGLAIGFRRLSIVDLSPSGHQPMTSSDGRYVIAFNGEVYNYKEIRHELDREAPNGWRGRSDTEVVLAAIARWGLARALKSLTGMFAFALWDRNAQALHLCRDRMGEKPLYYGWADGAFLFGSELKALSEFPGWVGEVDRNSVALYLRYCYVPAPFSIYKGIRKVLPGTTLAITVRTPVGTWPEPEPYWSLREVVEQGSSNPISLQSDRDASDELERVLLETVQTQMVADVPLGAFLSGGIDSSLIVALMQAQSPTPINTFTIGFHEKAFDEAIYAKDVAAHLGTAHTELYITPGQAMDIIPKLPMIYDEPFSDSSQIPTFLVSQLAKRQVTVALSGDGGDESFGGYRRYILGRRFWRLLRCMPLPLRKTLSTSFKSDRFDSLSNLLLSPSLRNAIATIANKGDSESPDELYLRLVSNDGIQAGAVINGIEPETLLAQEMSHSAPGDLVSRMMYLDSMTYLPDDIMVKVDRASMAVSLESRAPYLDRRIVEFAWSLPLSMKIRNGTSKWLLRNVLYRYVPRGLVERPKMGFGVPIGEWLRGPLKSWAEDLLDPSTMRRDGIFLVDPVRERWLEHVGRRKNWEHYLWNLLMFQAWLRNNRHSIRI